MISHLCLVLVLLLGLLAAGLFGDRADGGLVDDEACPALLLVPLEASEVGLVQFVIRLGCVSGRSDSEGMVTRKGGIGRECDHTFFLNCLWMASSASLIVTPLEFRAVTSKPSGKCKSILLTGGLTSFNLRMSLSSTVDGDVLSFLVDGQFVSADGGGTRGPGVGSDLPSGLLCLNGQGDFNLLLL